MLMRRKRLSQILFWRRRHGGTRSGINLADWGLSRRSLPSSKKPEHGTAPGTPFYQFERRKEQVERGQSAANDPVALSRSLTISSNLGQRRRGRVDEPKEGVGVYVPGRNKQPPAAGGNKISCLLRVEDGVGSLRLHSLGKRPRADR